MFIFDDDADEIVFYIGDVRNFAVVNIHFEGKRIEVVVDPFVAFMRFWGIFFAFVDLTGEGGVEEETAFNKVGFFTFGYVFVIDVFDVFEHGVDISEVFEFGFGSEGVEEDLAGAVFAEIKADIGDAFIGLHHAD